MHYSPELPLVAPATPAAPAVAKPPADEPALPPADNSRVHLAAIVDSSLDAIIGKDLNGIVTSWNASAELLFGHQAQDMIGTAITRLIPADRLREEDHILEKLRRGERVQHLETQRLTRDGRLIDVSVTVSPIRDAAGRLVGASKVARDISALKRNEREVARMSRLYAALSLVNQAIVWAATREELFSKVCEALVCKGGLRMAWVGWHDAETRRLVPVVRFGDGQDDLDVAEAYTDDRPQGPGPSGMAFRTDAPSIDNDLLADPGAAPSRAELERRGFLACAAFPIRLAGEPRGTLSVYADQQGFFHDKEVALLSEAAVDISFALDNFARDAARRMAEDAVRGEKEFSDTMLESMPGVVYFYDLDGRFLRWNRNFETVSGYGAHEIAGMHPIDFFSREDRPRVAQGIAQVVACGESSIEADFLSRDNTATPYFFTGKRVVFEAVNCLVGVGIDISERKRAETAVREAELLFHTLFEQTPVGVAVVDPASQRIVDCNTQAARQLGHAKAELVGMAMSDIEVIDTPNESGGRIARLLGEAHGEFETRHRAKSGEIRDVLVSGRLIELAGCKLIHCVFLDITDRKRAEARIRESEAHLVEAQRIAGIGSWALDVPTGRLQWSDQVYRIFEVSRAGFVVAHKTFMALVHADDRERLEGALQAALAGHARLDIEHRIVAGDGSEKVVHELADLTRGPGGEPLLLAGTVHDITARVRIEAERERRHRAEASDRIKSAFLATMSHELRTPLNSIIGFTGIILQGLAGPLNAEQGKQLGMVQSSARHLLALVNDVLDISKIEAGQLEVARAPFDPRRCIDKVVALMAPLALAKGLALEVNLAPVLGEGLGDERRFEQILLNLLSNAVKFSDTGHVMLAAELVATLPGDEAGAPEAAGALQAEPAFIRARVSDSGIGIRPEHLATLFQPFRQIDSGLARQHDGTGLGLAICKRLSALMGGEMSVDSTWGTGSTFTVTLPLKGPVTA
jgi:PAS domain S-box-containing protein